MDFFQLFQSVAVTAWNEDGPLMVEVLLVSRRTQRVERVLHTVMNIPFKAIKSIGRRNIIKVNLLVMHFHEATAEQMTIAIKTLLPLVCLAAMHTVRLPPCHPDCMMMMMMMHCSRFSLYLHCSAEGCWRLRWLAADWFNMWVMTRLRSEIVNHLPRCLWPNTSYRLQHTLRNKRKQRFHSHLLVACCCCCCCLQTAVCSSSWLTSGWNIGAIYHSRARRRQTISFNCGVARGLAEEENCFF